MSKPSPIPRLTIVVPLTKNRSDFESSLVSVLEHQPSGCEVIVPHDGSYDDPFNLVDEVRFVTSDSGELLDLVATSALAARGRFIHVLAGGLKATSGWVDSALEKFEHHDVAAVAPVVWEERTRRIVAAGWHDRASRLCHASGSGQTKLRRKTAILMDGVFLEASFWRRDALRSATQCYSGRDPIEFSYTSGLSLKHAGWRCVASELCEVLSDDCDLRWMEGSFRRGQRLWAIRESIMGERSSLRDGIRAMLGNVARPSLLSESLGQMAGSFAVRDIKRRVHADTISKIDDCETILSMPTRNHSASGNRKVA